MNHCALLVKRTLVLVRYYLPTTFTFLASKLPPNRLHFVMKTFVLLTHVYISIFNRMDIADVNPHSIKTTFTTISYTIAIVYDL